MWSIKAFMYAVTSILVAVVLATIDVKISALLGIIATILVAYFSGFRTIMSITALVGLQIILTGVLFLPVLSAFGFSGLLILVVAVNYFSAYIVEKLGI